ncbi:MAG: aspartate--tRNA(Asn) ligase [Candidatus Woesearchaeota archaeon]
MTRTKINQLTGLVDKTATIKGFVQEVRSHSKVKFLVVRDRYGIVQCVVKDDKEFFEEVAKISRESVISVTGVVVSSQQASSGVELQVSSYEVLSESDPELPLQVVDKGSAQAGLSTRLDWRWLELRKPHNALIFEIWTFMEKVMREWWDTNDFLQIYSPKLMGTPSESGAELFGIDYFGQQAYLAQSPQFYKQMAMAAGFEKIFEIGPVFRANPSHTSRHDTEFTMVDMEISFIDSHEDVMQVEESWLSYILGRVHEEYGSKIKEMFGVDVVVPTTPFPRIRFADAIRRLQEEKGHHLEGDLDSEGEKLLFELIKEEFGHEFVFVTDYPWSIRPFYHMKKDSSETKSFDLLWKGLEITTGAQREQRPDVLKQQAVEKGLDLGILEDYLNFFRFGCPPHGGFAVSPTRMLMLLLGIKNVREVTFLPRDTQRLTP